MSTDAFDYRDLKELVRSSGSPLALAELHGGLSGVICSGGRAAAERWLEDLLDDCAADSATQAELARALEGLSAATWDALSGMSLEFAPLLPDDDDQIGERADALALWCHGFLAGLVIGGLDLSGGQADLAPELNELVGDFAEISKAGADAGELDDDLSEASLTELAEFVRVGVQFVFEELTRESVRSDRRVLH